MRDRKNRHKFGWLLAGAAVLVALGWWKMKEAEESLALAEPLPSEKGSASDTVNALESSEEEEEKTAEKTSSSEETPVASLCVHVDGAVQRPGLYAFTEGARVQDAIEAAGGLSDEADLRSLNISMRLRDEMKITVPREGEDLPTTSSPVEEPAQTSSPSEGTEKIDLNQAGLEELMRLPSIGEKRARTIIDARPFENVEALREVDGIGEKTFEKLKELVIVR